MYLRGNLIGTDDGRRTTDDDDDGRHTLNLYYYYEVFFSSVTNENFDKNSHRQTKQKIPKSSLSGSYLHTTKQKKTKKGRNSFRRLEGSASGRNHYGTRHFFSLFPSPPHLCTNAGRISSVRLYLCCVANKERHAPLCNILAGSSRTIHKPPRSMLYVFSLPETHPIT